MRFINLVMQAFGTFKDKVEINFNNLNKGGIFLITGPTGSGKTTIFDAICFALYGELSSIGNSSQQKIRSDFATSNDITYVELEFQIQNKNYYIKRIPNQDNVVTKKGNIGSIKHDVILKYDDTLITDIKGVSEKINEIIGLNCNMFKQVVMLPQNEFRKLLDSKTSEKETIFRNVFQTFNINNFQERIYNDCKDKINEIKEKTTILNTLISRIDDKYRDLDNNNYQNYDDIISDIKNMNETKKNESKDKKEKLNTLSFDLNKLNQEYNDSILLNKNIDSYNEYLKKNEDLDNDLLIDKYRNILTKYQNAKNLSEAYNNLNSGKEEIESLNNDLLELEELEINKQNERKEASSKKVELQNKKNEIDSIRLKRIELNQEYEKAQTKEKVRSEYLQLDEEINDLSIDNERDIEEKNNLIIEKEKVEEKVNELKENLIDIPSLYKEKDELNEVLKRLNEIKEKLVRKEELKALIEDCELEFNRLKIENINLSGLKEKTKRKMRLNLASSLAKDLHDGVPCPVCGATNHPNLASFDQNITEDDLTKILADEAKNNTLTDQIISDKRNHALERVEVEDYLGTNDLVLEYDLNMTNIDSYIKKYEDDINNIFANIDNATINNSEYTLETEKLKAISDKILELSAKIDKFEKDNLERLEEYRDKKAQLKLYDDTRDIKEIETDLTKVNEEISEYEKECDKYNDLEVSLLDDIIEIGKKKSEINASISAKKMKLDIYQEDINKYKALFNSIEEYELCLNTNYSEIEEYVKEYDSNKAIILNKLNELKPLIENKEKVDLAIIEENINNLNIEIENLKVESIKLESNISSLEEEIDEIINSYNLIKDKIAIKNRLKKLSDLANGSYLSKITFEQYILSIYFEDVIDEANILLKDMSKNRFQLIRRKTLTGRGYQGLEIDLFDSNTTSIRSVDTFSGGESFLASLSLALGLSNVIRRNSSLLSIDTLFIDEGFGSLDMDKLDNAYNILCSLRKNDRVIGIISHISELKNRVENQIVVKKTDLGSSITIID